MPWSNGALGTLGAMGRLVPLVSTGALGVNGAEPLVSTESLVLLRSTGRLCLRCQWALHLKLTRRSCLWWALPLKSTGRWCLWCQRALHLKSTGCFVPLASVGIALEVNGALVFLVSANGALGALGINRVLGAFEVY